MVIRQRQLRWPIPQTLEKILPQKTIIAVKRRAKYILITVPTGAVIMHLGMSGSVRMVDHDHPVQPHDHVDILLDNNRCLRYTDPRRFGAILWQAGDPLQHPLLQSLGPEPLSHDFHSDYLLQQIHNKRSAIKTVIMNSHIVVGIGNIYANEALFASGIHPQSPAKNLSSTQCQQLVTAIKKILQQAIAQGGTTLKDFYGSDGNPGYFKQSLAVYGREGLPCVQCHTPLQSMRLGQRATVYCQQCQPA